MINEFDLACSRSSSKDLSLPFSNGGDSFAAANPPSDHTSVLMPARSNSFRIFRTELCKLLAVWPVERCGQVCTKQSSEEHFFKGLHVHAERKMKIHLFFQLAAASVALLPGLASAIGVDYTDGPIAKDGDAILFQSNTAQDATLLSQDTFSGNLDLTVEFADRHFCGEGYQAGVVLFLAPPDATVEDLTTNDNDFVRFEQGTVASLRDRLTTAIDYTYYSLRNLGPDGQVVNNAQVSQEGQNIEGRKFRLVRQDSSYHSPVWSLPSQTMGGLSTCRCLACGKVGAELFGLEGAESLS